MSACFLCANSGGQVLYQNQLYRIVLVEDEFYPGYLRIITQKHILELSDLNEEDNLKLYQAVIYLEKILRRLLNPDKINLASFANQTPHVHWHLISRFKSDRHFPNPIWGAVTNLNYTPPLIALELVQQLPALVLKQFNPN